MGEAQWKVIETKFLFSTIKMPSPNETKELFLSPLNWLEFSTSVYSALFKPAWLSSPSFSKGTLISFCGTEGELLWANQNTDSLSHCFKDGHVT